VRPSFPVEFDFLLDILLLEVANEELIKIVVVSEEHLQDLDHLVPAVNSCSCGQVPHDFLPSHCLQIYAFQLLHVQISFYDFDVVEDEVFGVVLVL